MRKNMILFYFVISNYTPYQQTIESDYNKKKLSFLAIQILRKLT